MKKFLWFLPFALFVQLLNCFNTVDVHSNNSGAQAGYTGSPNENNSRTCSSQNGGCHTGAGTTFQQGMITSNVPECGYNPGQTYTITLTVSSAGRSEFGFSVSPQLSNGSTAGSMIASTGTQLNGGGRYLTHTTAGTVESSPNTRVWTFDWIAPAAGSGDVTFYAAFNAANGNNASSGDLLFNSNLVIFEGLQPEQPTIFGDNVACLGSVINLSTNYTNNIVWNPSNQTTQEIQVSSNSTVQVTVTNECGTSTSSPFNVSFEPLPVTPAIVFNESTASLECSILGSYTYNWYLNGVQVADSVSSSFFPTENGSYAVSISTPSGCQSELSEPFPWQSLKVQAATMKQLIDLYPNPNIGSVFIKNSSNNNMSAVLYDQVGHEVNRFEFNPGSNLVNLNVRPGLYFLQLESDLVHKLIVY
jgi:hypothetical protein